MPKYAPYLIGLIILPGILIVYAPALTIFLRGDDFEWLNSSYAAWSHPAQLLEPINNFFRPVVKLSYLLNYTFGGRQPIVYNVTTIGLHLINVFLLYALMLKITRQWGTAALIAVLFGYSSFYSEVTLWAAGRPDSLLLLFMLAALLVVAEMPPHPGPMRQIALVLLTMGALGSKETWILLPILTTAFCWLVQRQSWRRALRLTYWQWALFLIYLGIFIGLPLIRGADSPTSYATADIHAILVKFTHLIMRFCGADVWFSGELWQLALVIPALLGLAGWAFRSQNRLAGWGLLWMMLTLGIGLPIYYEPSRYNYLPLVGFWVCVTALGEPALRRLAQAVNMTPTFRKVVIGCLLAGYISQHARLLRAEIRDYDQYGAFHEAIVDRYVHEQDRIPLHAPILLVNRGTQKPIPAVAEAAQGYPKLFFVRPTALWEMLFFQSLANFAGEPFQRLYMPVENAQVLPVLNARVTAVMFTDHGFRVLDDDDEMRATLRQLYHTHGRLPDNVTLYTIVPTEHYGHTDYHPDL